MSVLRLIPERWSGPKRYVAFFVAVVLIGALLAWVSWRSWALLELKRQQSRATSCHSDLRLIMHILSEAEVPIGDYWHEKPESMSELLDQLVAGGFIDAETRAMLSCGGHDYILATDYNKRRRAKGAFRPILIMYCPEDNAHPLIGKNALYSNGRIEHGIVGKPKAED